MVVVSDRYPSSPGAMPTSTRRVTERAAAQGPCGSASTPAATGGVAAVSSTRCRTAPGVDAHRAGTRRICSRASVPTATAGGRRDEHLPVARARRHRPRSDPTRAHPGPAAPPRLTHSRLGLSGPAPAGHLRRGPALPQGRGDRAALRDRDQAPRRDPVDLAGRAHHPRAGAQLPVSPLGLGPQPAFRRAFGEVDKAYRGMDNTWVYFHAAASPSRRGTS